MKRTVLAALALGTLASLSGTPAHAETFVVVDVIPTLVVRPPAPVTGLTCGMLSVSDLQGQPAGAAQFGVFFGGPVTTLPDLSPQVQIRCTIQVNHQAHNGADTRSASASAPHTTVLLPQVVAYTRAEGDVVFLCTQVTVGATTWYWDGENDVWSLSSAVRCTSAASIVIVP